jgi:hypothetical protein
VWKVNEDAAHGALRERRGGRRQNTIKILIPLRHILVRGRENTNRENLYPLWEIRRAKSPDTITRTALTTGALLLSQESRPVFETGGERINSRVAEYSPPELFAQPKSAILRAAFAP